MTFHRPLSSSGATGDPALVSRSIALRSLLSACGPERSACWARPLFDQRLLLAVLAASFGARAPSNLPVAMTRATRGRAGQVQYGTCGMPRAIVPDTTPVAQHASLLPRRPLPLPLTLRRMKGMAEIVKLCPPSFACPTRSSLVDLGSRLPRSNPAA